MHPLRDRTRPGWMLCRQTTRLELEVLHEILRRRADQSAA